LVLVLIVSTVSGRGAQRPDTNDLYLLTLFKPKPIAQLVTITIGSSVVTHSAPKQPSCKLAKSYIITARLPSDSVVDFNEYS